MCVLLKVYQCSISKNYEYKLIDDMEFYTVKSLHNNRIAVANNVGNILWIEDKDYNLRIGDNIRFNRYGIKKYDQDGYVIDVKDYNYDTKVKDIKDVEAKTFAIKSILNSCKDLKMIIDEAEIDLK